MNDHRIETEQPSDPPGTGAWTGSLDAVSALVAMVDSGGRIVKVNRAFAESMGCDARDLECCELWELVEAEQVEVIRRLFSPSAPLDRPRVVRLQWLTGDNHRRPVFNPNAAGFADLPDKSFSLHFCFLTCGRRGNKRGRSSCAKKQAVKANESLGYPQPGSDLVNACIHSLTEEERPFGDPFFRLLDDRPAVFISAGRNDCQARCLCRTLIDCDSGFVA